MNAEKLIVKYWPIKEAETDGKLVIKIQVLSIEEVYSDMPCLA